MRKRDVLAYDRNREANLFALHARLVDGSYRHDAYEQFYIHDPKRRHISKATVEDRIVHQAIVQVIEPLFERQFIIDSYSSRQGKGTHAMIERCASFLRDASRHNTRTVWILKCDVRKFFDSVRHDILLRRLERTVTDVRLRALLEIVVTSYHAGAAGRGLPLGNVTSQLFANVYLNPLDHYIKERLHARWYARFCDDMIFVHPSREFLERTALSHVGSFLGQRCALTLHPKKMFLRKYTQGMDVLGMVLRPSARTLRTVTKHRFLRNIRERLSGYHRGMCDDDAVRGTLDSYRALLDRGHHHAVRGSLDALARTTLF